MAFKSILAASMCGCFSVVSFNPLDCLRIRWQNYDPVRCENMVKHVTAFAAYQPFPHNFWINIRDVKMRAGLQSKNSTYTSPVNIRQFGM